MSYLVSHLFFIILLVFTIINPWLPIYRWKNLLPPFHEWLLLLWFCGILSTTMSNPPDKAGFGSIKLVNLVIGFTAILVHIIGALFLPDDLIPYILFTRNQLLALVLLLSFVELLNFLTFHHLFGPWAVIIQDLMKDMMRFLVIMGIFLVGFSLTVSAIYVPVFEPPIQSGLISPGAGAGSGSDSPVYNHNQLPAAQQIGAGQSVVPTLGLEFQSPLFTFEMLFYSLFGLVEPDFMPPMHSSPAFSKVIMKFVFGVYMMITVVVLINLLIAMMSNTYQRIEARSDIEWKFGRAKLIRNMIRTSPTPSPLILLMGIWIDYYREFRRKQFARQKVEKMAVAAFNQKATVNEMALKAAQIWMSKAPQLSRRRELEQRFQVARAKRSSANVNGPGIGANNSGITPTRQSVPVSGGRDSMLQQASFDIGSNSLGNSKLDLQQQQQQQSIDSLGNQSKKTSFWPNRAASICQIPEANSVQGSQIHEVVNWPSVIRKYWENVGVVMEKEEEVVAEQASGGSGSGSGSATNNGGSGNNSNPTNIVTTTISNTNTNTPNDTDCEGVAGLRAA